MNTFFLGIDAGTGSLRACVFDAQGHCLGNGEGKYETYYPQNGWAEQDPEEWSRALSAAIPTSLKEAGIAPRELTAIVCDATTNTLVFLDSEGEPVRRSLLWMDVRAAAEATELEAFRREHPAMEVYKPAFRADTMIPKCMWYRRHEPLNWTKTRTVFEFEDWLNYLLTGEKTLGTSIAAFRWNYDSKLGGMPTALWRAAGIGDVEEKLPARLLSMGERVGAVTADAAARFGLAEGIPVYAGTADCNAGMLGTGCVRTDQLALIGGTSTVLLGHAEMAFHMDGVNGTYPDCLIPGLGLAEGGQTASGAVLAWFKNNLLPASWAEESAARDMNIYDLIGEKAAAAPLGSGGVMMLDSFQGNRAPYADSNARGMFLGLSLATDTACIARAIYEGVAFGADLCISAMLDAGMKIDSILACGGICASPFWLQMHADVIGIPIVTVADTQHCPQLGDALIAAVASGIYPNLSAASAVMIRTGCTYSPDPAAHEAYSFYRARFRELWPAVRDTVHRLVEHENVSG